MLAVLSSCGRGEYDHLFAAMYDLSSRRSLPTAPSGAGSTCFTVTARLGWSVSPSIIVAAAEASQPGEAQVSALCVTPFGAVVLISSLSGGGAVVQSNGKLTKASDARPDTKNCFLGRPWDSQASSTYLNTQMVSVT